MTLYERMDMYEKSSVVTYTQRLPIIIRVDGIKFSRFTKNFKKPFDDNFGKMMLNTARKVAESLEGCMMFTTHSDEISFFINTYQKLDQPPLYKNNKTKIETSVSAKVTVEFARQLMNFGMGDLVHLYEGFDARSFLLPKEEVLNYFFNRQISSRRNSIQMYAREYFTQKEIDGLSGEEMVDKMLTEKGFDWETVSDWEKFGYFGTPKILVSHNGAEMLKAYKPSEFDCYEALQFKGEYREKLNEFVDYSVH